MFFVVAKLQMVFACRLNRISTHYIIHWYQDTWWSVMWWLPSYRLMSVFVSFANVLCEFYWINWDQRFHTFSSCFTTRHPLSTTWCILYITWGDIYIYMYIYGCSSSYMYLLESFVWWEEPYTELLSIWIQPTIQSYAGKVSLYHNLLALCTDIVPVHWIENTLIHFDIWA